MDSKHKVILKTFLKMYKKCFLYFLIQNLLLFAASTRCCLFVCFFLFCCSWFLEELLSNALFFPSLSLSLRSCVKTLQHLLVCESSVCFVVDQILHLNSVLLYYLSVCLSLSAASLQLFSGFCVLVCVCVCVWRFLCCLVLVP